MLIHASTRAQGHYRPAIFHPLDQGMDNPSKASLISPTIGAGVVPELSDSKLYNQGYCEGDARPYQPTSLQSGEEAGMIIRDNSHYKTSPLAPAALRSESGLSYSPRPSQAESQPTTGTLARLPLEQFEELSYPQSTSSDSAVRDSDDGVSRSMTASPVKAQSYSQLRNISSPLPDGRNLGHSSPPSPRATTSAVPNGISHRSEFRSMPRTSSIDSAISTLSTARPHTASPSLDSFAAAPPDISNLVRAAGSPEAVIRHLLKEKHSTDARNAQLWKLVDKQRTMVLGLNQDLERALKDKERYRKKLKEHQKQIPPVPSSLSSAPESQLRAASRSPAPSDASADLPIQRQSLDHAKSNDRGNISTPIPHKRSKDGNHNVSPEVETVLVQEADDWVKNKGRGKGANHSHKQTSSSDVGIYSSIGSIRSEPPLLATSPNQTKVSGARSIPAQATAIERAVASPTTSFTAKRSQPFSSRPFNGPPLNLNESHSHTGDQDTMTPPRKAPPAPLDLGQPKAEQTIQAGQDANEQSGSEYEDDMEVDELPALDRGRKKTREDDDKEREAALLKEKQDRSHSKKEKGSKTPAEMPNITTKDSAKPRQEQKVILPIAVEAPSPEAPNASNSFLSPPTSMASVLKSSDAKGDSDITERSIAMKALSPGLPLSPRPSDRPVNPPTPRMPRDGIASSVVSPPLSPKNSHVGLPTSPRAPRQPIPFPPHTPMSMAPSSPVLPSAESRNDLTLTTRGISSPIETNMPSIETQMDPELLPSTKMASEASKAESVFAGFASEAYPGLLLPPNALPSIRVKVVSSRLKPSRNSIIIKGVDDEPVFTLGVSARFDQRDLWQVEKPTLSLHQLDQQLRQSSTFNVKVPDRSLFSGHAPAKIDARRIALENYFEAVLDTQMDEKEAVVLCNYLSSAPINTEKQPGAATVYSGSPVAHSSDGKLAKEGFLTKRGKNFGGWKARYFVLKDPILRYYETPGGTLLGEIKLHHAQIGKQSPNKPSNSPSRGDDHDSQYRHAFLIRQPKRKDSNSFMDHVLCAESDAERDSWVAALLCHVEGSGSDSVSSPSVPTADSGSNKPVMPSKKNSFKDAVLADSPESDTFESLQAVPYEELKPAQAPRVRVTPDPRPTESPSPSTSGSQPSLRASSAQPKAISGPQNGVKISDVGAWGNKPIAAPLTNPKEQKKRSIWGFRDKNPSDIGTQHPNDSNLSLTQQQYQEQITNVKAAFGAPLVDAVESCGPRGFSDTHLPAVVYRCLEYLEVKDAASEEGIFRMSGSNVLIKGLKSRFNAEGDFNFLADDHYYDVHAVASLLKLYLRELPSMILTRELHFQFAAVLGKREACVALTHLHANLGL